jgi:hypothetical protein
MSYKVYVLQDSRKRIVTDKEGNPRVWYNKKQAEKDAKYLSQKLGVKLKPVLFGTSDSRFYGTISKANRIEL